MFNNWDHTNFIQIAYITLVQNLNSASILFVHHA